MVFSKEINSEKKLTFCLENPLIFEGMAPNSIKSKRILISPLNWGQGHVSRCIGLIHQLCSQDNVVIIACDSAQRAVFREYFPDLTYVHHEGYPFFFRGNGLFALDLFSNLPKLRRRLKEEQREVESLVKKHAIDFVVSDHRYGFRSKFVTSIFVTHQYNLPVNWFQSLVDFRHKKLMKRFQAIWILDTPKQEFAGKLSRAPKEESIHYIGVYSRFALYESLPEKDLPSVAIISGPHVYAQQFADWIVEHYPEALVVCSDAIVLPASQNRVSDSWRTQDRIIMRAQRVISRSGYSTIMDLHFLDTPAIYIPTNGQKEQMYLAEIHTMDAD